MTLVPTLPRSLHELLEYDAISIERLIEHLRRTPESPDRAREILAHMVSARAVWIARLEGRDSAGMEIWPDLSLEACSALASDTQVSYAAFLSRVTEADLAAEAVYRNSKGIKFRTRVLDILLHVIVHGGYHRGQIALLLRQAGAEPINTDYITYVREAR